MSYFVTGATGFIGRYLVQELLDNREGEVFVLVREGSKRRMERLCVECPQVLDAIQPVGVQPPS